MRQDDVAMKSSVKAVLAVDVGGTSVKILATGQSERRSFSSGPTLTPRRMVSEVKKLAGDWIYDVVSIGYPGPVLHGRPIAEPYHLATRVGRVRFWRGLRLSRQDRQRRRHAGLGELQGRQNALSRPRNRAWVGHHRRWHRGAHGARSPALQEGHYEDYVGRAGLKRHGKKQWRRDVADVVARLIAALEPDDTVLGGGNVKKLEALPPHCRAGDNANAFRGGFRLWGETPLS